MLRDVNTYSNKGQTLQRENIPDPKKLKVEIFKKPYNKFAGDYIVPLKTPFSASELKHVVKNSGCYNNTLCYWNIDELIIYLTENMGYDDKKKLSYFCPNCMKQFQNNKRYVQYLYLQKNITTFIQIAKTNYFNNISDDPKGRNFKKGTLKFTKSGQIVYSFSNKIKVQGIWQQKTYNIKLKQQDLRLEKAITIQFDKNDIYKNIQSIKMLENTLATQLSAKVSTMINFLKLNGAITENKKSQIIMQICNQINKTLEVNIKFVPFVKQQVNKTFTFAFTNNIHLNSLNQDFSFLTLFYPHHKLWRKFFLQFNDGDPYIHPQGALYIKVDSKIYIIGGTILRYGPHPTDYRLKKKIHTPLTSNTLIDLTQVDPLKPNRVVEIEKKKLIKIKSKVSQNQQDNLKISKVMSNQNKQKVKVIDQMYPNNIIVNKLAPIPQSLSLSSGVYYNGNIYVFSGTKVVDQKQVVSPSAYAYNIQSNKWNKLKDIPTPRRNHITFIYNDLIYIIGGVLGTQTQQFLSPSTRKMQIYNPKTNQYISKQIPENNFISCTRAELFNFRAIPLKLKNQFMLINGQRPIPFIINPQNLTYSLGKSQMVLNIVCPSWGGSNSSEGGIKFQQIFDQNPPQYNGNYYYLHYSVIQDKTRLVTGDFQGWILSQQYNPANSWIKPNQL